MSVGWQTWVGSCFVVRLLHWATRSSMLATVAGSRCRRSGHKWQTCYCGWITAVVQWSTAINDPFAGSGRAQGRLLSLPVFTRSLKGIHSWTSCPAKDTNHSNNTRVNSRAVFSNVPMFYLAIHLPYTLLKVDILLSMYGTIPMLQIIHLTSAYMCPGSQSTFCLAYMCVLTSYFDC